MQKKTNMSNFQCHIQSNVFRYFNHFSNVSSLVQFSCLFSLWTVLKVHMTNYFCLLSIIGLSNVIVFWKIGKQKLKRSLFSQGYRSWICNLVELRQKWPRLLWGVAWLWWMFHMWTTKALLSCVYDLYKKKHICSVYKRFGCCCVPGWTVPREKRNICTFETAPSIWKFTGDQRFPIISTATPGGTQELRVLM